MLKKRIIRKVLLLLVVVVMTNFYFGCVHRYYPEDGVRKSNNAWCEVCGEGSTQWIMDSGKLVCLECYKKGGYSNKGSTIDEYIERHGTK